MGEKTIVERVDDLYKGYPGDQPQQLDAFLSQIHTLYSDAAKRMRQHLLLILLLWGVGYLIGAGIVEEGQVAAFKVGKVESLLVAWPPLLGVISYLLSTAVMAEGTLQRVMSRAYKHVLPKVYEHDLQYLLTIGTFVGLERFIEPEQPKGILKRVFVVWLDLLQVLMIFGPLAALGHVSYLLWVGESWGAVAVVTSALVGLTFWLRGLGVWIVGQTRLEG